MTIAILPFAEARLQLNLHPWPDLTDEGFFELCGANPDLRLERTAKGEIIIMPPAGGESGHRNVRVVSALDAWARANGSGTVFGESAGFRLPNNAVLAPDASWVDDRRLAQLSPEQLDRFLPLCADFVVEVRSRSDRIAELRAKMQEYMDNGARLGWLIDPYQRTVDVYRPGQLAIHLAEPAELAGDPELPGFALELGSIWRGLRARD